jgi:hypothetical protein
MQRHILRAKIAVRESADESRRFATVKGLDDQLAAATAAIATQPSAYRIGTLAALAAAYDGAGAPEQAAETRWLALLEPLFLPFARLGVAAQQRHLENLTGSERAFAEGIVRRQTDAFDRDPYAAGTALYPGVGAPAPIQNIDRRITQARMIAERRGIPVAPFTANDVGGIRESLSDGPPEERHALLTHLNALPDDMKAALAPLLAPPPRSEDSASTGQSRNSVVASLSTSPQQPKSWHLPRDERPSEPLDQPPRPLPVPDDRPRLFFEPLPITPPRPLPPPTPVPPRPPEAPPPQPGNDIALLGR